MNDHSDLGLVTTPPKTADYIISRLLPIKENEKILDPCVGTGIFVKGLIKNGIKSSQIQTMDINPDYQSKIEEMGISFLNQDYLLSLSPFSYNQYDFIIGNPPYLNKASAYIRKNKNILQKIYGKINAHETYSMFIVSSIRRLKNGGKFRFYNK